MNGMSKGRRMGQFNAVHHTKLIVASYLAMSGLDGEGPSGSGLQSLPRRRVPPCAPAADLETLQKIAYPIFVPQLS